MINSDKNRRDLIFNKGEKDEENINHRYFHNFIIEFYI